MQLLNYLIAYSSNTNSINNLVCHQVLDKLWFVHCCLFHPSLPISLSIYNREYYNVAFAQISNPLNNNNNSTVRIGLVYAICDLLRLFFLHFFHFFLFFVFSFVLIVIRISSILFLHIYAHNVAVL